MIRRILHSRHFLACHGNGALLPDAIPGRQNLSEGHGHSLCAGLHLLQVLLHPLSLYDALHRLFNPAFRHLHFRPSRQAARFGQANYLFILPLGKGQTFLSWWARYITRVSKGLRKRRAGWSSRNEGSSRASRSWVRSALGKTASCMHAFAEQILAYRDEDYCGADKDDPIYYAQHTVMKAQAELQRQSNAEKAGEDRRTTTKEIALDH